MKRLKGGLILLNLTALSLAFIGKQDDIEDVGVLKQLEELRNFIGAERNLKPVLVQTRDSDAKVNPIFECSMASYGDEDSFAISGIFTYPDGTTKTLVINVTFEFVEYEGYKIDSASITTSSGITHIKVSNVKSIDGDILEQLKAGDIVVKADATGEHPYIVSFKSATGICLTYTDASCIETQSYDKVGQNWVYNSEDKGTLPEFAPSGTIQDVLGLDSNGKLVKGAVSGGIKLYKHLITFTPDQYRLCLITDNAKPIHQATSTDEMGNLIAFSGKDHNQYGKRDVICIGTYQYQGAPKISYYYLSSGTNITAVTSDTITGDTVSEL